MPEPLSQIQKDEVKAFLEARLPPGKLPHGIDTVNSEQKTVAYYIVHFDSAEDARWWSERLGGIAKINDTVKTALIISPQNMEILDKDAKEWRKQYNIGHGAPTVPPPLVPSAPPLSRQAIPAAPAPAMPTVPPPAPLAPLQAILPTAYVTIKLRLQTLLTTLKSNSVALGISPESQARLQQDLNSLNVDNIKEIERIFKAAIGSELNPDTLQTALPTLDTAIQNATSPRPQAPPAPLQASPLHPAAATHTTPVHFSTFAAPPSATVRPAPRASVYSQPTTSVQIEQSKQGHRVSVEKLAEMISRLDQTRAQHGPTLNLDNKIIFFKELMECLVRANPATSDPKQAIEEAVNNIRAMDPEFDFNQVKENRGAISGVYNLMAMHIAKLPNNMFDKLWDEATAPPSVGYSPRQ